MSEPLEAGNIAYPVGKEVLTSVDQFRERFIPDYLDVQKLNRRVQRSLELVSQHLGSGQSGRALDYGCGAGAVTYHLARLFPKLEVEGWEGDPSSFRIATECFAGSGATFRLHDYQELKLIGEGHFRLITFLEVIEHVPDVRAVLTTLKKALTERGFLLVSTPYALGWATVREELAFRVAQRVRRRNRAEVAGKLDSRGYDPTTHQGHVASYTPLTLSTILLSAGLRIVDVDLVARSGSPLHRLMPDTLLILAQRRDSGDEEQNR